MVLQGKQRLGAETHQGWRSPGEGCLTIPPSQDGFSGIEDDADEALEISQAQLLYESRRKGQRPPPPPSNEETESKPPPCQGEAPKGAGAPKGSEVAPGPGEEESDGDGGSDSDDSSEDEER